MLKNIKLKIWNRLYGQPIMLKSYGANENNT